MKIKILEISYDDSKNTFVLDLEGENIYLTYEELEEYKLSKGDLIDLELYNTLKNLSYKNQGLAMALKYISSRLISSFKLRNYLSNKGIENAAIDIIIDELKENKLIDDELFLECYIKDKKDINLRSKKHIYMDLVSMGFDSELVNIYLEDYEDSEEVEIARELLNRKNYFNRKSREQIFRYLAGRSFKYDSINNLLDGIGD